MRAKSPHRVGEGLQPLTERHIHVAGLDIGLVQRLGEPFRRHLQASIVPEDAGRPPIRMDPELLRFTPGVLNSTQGREWVGAIRPMQWFYQGGTGLKMRALRIAWSRSSIAIRFR